MKHLMLSAMVAAFAAVCTPTLGAGTTSSEVRVPAGDIELAGRLHVPSSAEGAPAVVLSPGSQGSRNLAGMAEALAERGVIALDLNKRGVAGSGGSWLAETIDERAADTLHAVEWLRGQQGVDASRIGVIGHSQGGWVAQAAAAMSDDVAFVVLLAGPAQTVRDQILTDERNHLLGWGVPAPQVDERIGMFDQLLQAALTNPGVCGPAGAGHYLCGLFFYDPADALSRLRAPVLALYGERDPLAAPEVNARLLREALESAGNADFEIEIVPEANHLFWPAVTGLTDEYASLEPVYAPGLLDRISGWVLAR